LSLIALHKLRRSHLHGIDVIRDTARPAPGTVLLEISQMTESTDKGELDIHERLLEGILAPVPPSPAHLFPHPSLLPLLIHHFVYL